MESLQCASESGVPGVLECFQNLEEKKVKVRVHRDKHNARQTKNEQRQTNKQTERQRDSEAGRE